MYIRNHKVKCLETAAAAAALCARAAADLSNRNMLLSFWHVDAFMLAHSGTVSNSVGLPTEGTLSVAASEILGSAQSAEEARVVSASSTRASADTHAEDARAGKKSGTCRLGCLQNADSLLTQAPCLLL